MEARTARPLRHCNARVVVSGMGAERAQATARALLDAGAGGLLVWGIAGGLEAELRPGTLLLPRRVIDAAGDAFPSEPRWREHLARHIPEGMKADDRPVVTVSHPVSGRDAKTALARQSGAVAVDLETAAVARLARERGVPFAAVRAIADPLELALPGVLRRARSGRFLALEVALRSIVRPRDWPRLAALSRATRAARLNLACLAERLAETHQGSGLY